MKNARTYFGLLVLGLLVASTGATTYNLPGNAVYDLGKLPKSRFDAKWGGGEIPDGFGPVREGRYVSYAHGKLTYYFGPYPDAASHTKARSHLDGLRAQLIQQDPKFTSARVESVEVSGKPDGTEGGSPTGPGKKPEGKNPSPESGEPENPPKGILGSQSKNPEGQPGGEGGKPGDTPAGERPGDMPSPPGEPGSGKPGKESPEEQPGSPGGTPGEKPSGEPAEGKTSPGEAPGQPGEGEAPETGEGTPEEQSPGSGEGKPEEGNPDGSGEAKPMKEGAEGNPEEGKPGEAEGEPAEGEAPEGESTEGEPATGEPTEGEPAEGKPGDGQPGETVPEAPESGEAPAEGETPESAPEGSQAAERPEGKPAEPVSANEPPPDWPQEVPEKTGSFEEKASGSELSGREALEKILRAWPPFFGAALPAQVDLSRDMPRPGDQGAAHSCTSWALAYGLKSFQEQREQGWSVYDGGSLNPKRIYSPSYLHHQISDGTAAGATFPEGLKVLREKGACTWALMPYTAETAMNKASAGAHSNADMHRVDFYRLVKSYSIKDVKAQLHAGYPVLIGGLMDPAFEKVKGEVIWKQEKSEEPATHAMLCVGYDDQRGAFKIFNSWGEKWGDRGIGWIEYETFTQVVAEAFVVKDGRSVRKRPLPEWKDFNVVIESHEALEDTLVFKGTTTTAPEYPGRMTLQIQFYNPDNSPVQASEQRYSTIHGQAGNDSAPVTLPVPAGHAWTLRIPRKALVTEAGTLSAEVIQFVDHFGLAASDRYTFEFKPAEPEPKTKPVAEAPPPETAEGVDTAAVEQQSPPDAVELPVLPEGPEAPARAGLTDSVSMRMRLSVFLGVVLVTLTVLGFSIRAVLRKQA